MVNIKEVAKKAKVSISTVSRVINSSGPVKEETRQKVIRAIDELEYIPNPLAQGLVKQTSRSIGLVVPKIRLYFAHIIKGVEQVAINHGYTLYMCTTDYSPKVEENYIKQLILHSVDGVIVASGELSNKSREMLAEAKKPVVYINREWDYSEADSFYSDDFHGANLIVEHLYELGHKNIGVLVDDQETDETKNKLDGIFAAAKEKGLCIDPELIVRCPNTMGGGLKGGRELLDRGRPTAIIAFSDGQAVGGIRAAKELGLKVPDQVSFTGFNNTELAQFFDPPLTTVDVKPRRLGKLACQRLFTRLQSKKKLPIVKKKLEVKLITGDSCRKIDERREKEIKQV